MNAFWRTLQVDIRRALLSSRFLFTVILFELWMLFNCSSYFEHYSVAIDAGIPYLLSSACSGVLELGPLLFVISAIPYAGSYLLDHECGIDDQIMIRSGVSTYYVCRMISVSISAFTSSFFAIIIFIVLLTSIGVPHTVFGYQGNYIDLSLEGTVWHYYLVRSMITGLTCSLSANASLISTIFIPNKYVGLIAPLIMYYLYRAIFHLLWLFTGGSSILSLFNIEYVIFGQVSGNNISSFVWSVIFLLTGIALCGRCFLRNVRKELST